MKKNESLLVRMTAPQKKQLEAHARRLGLGTSTWLLMLGLQAVAQHKQDKQEGTR